MQHLLRLTETKIAIIEYSEILDVPPIFIQEWKKNKNERHKLVYGVRPADYDERIKAIDELINEKLKHVFNKKAKLESITLTDTSVRFLDAKPTFFITGGNFLEIAKAISDIDENLRKQTQSFEDYEMEHC